MSQGADKLRRQGEVYAITRLRQEAGKLRVASQLRHHEEPEIHAAYLTLAFHLEEAARVLWKAAARRREEAGEER